MTNEKFDQAQRLKNEIATLTLLDDILVQASTIGHKLAVVDVVHYDVLEADVLPEYIVNGFRAIVEQELLKLNKEFNEL